MTLFVALELLIRNLRPTKLLARCNEPPGRASIALLKYFVMSPGAFGEPAQD